MLGHNMKVTQLRSSIAVTPTLICLSESLSDLNTLWVHHTICLPPKLDRLDGGSWWPSPFPPHWELVASLHAQFCQSPACPSLLHGMWNGMAWSCSRGWGPGLCSVCLQPSPTGSWFGESDARSASIDVILVAWNGLWCECLHHGNRKSLESGPARFPPDGLFPAHHCPWLSTEGSPGAP